MSNQFRSMWSCASAWKALETAIDGNSWGRQRSSSASTIALRILGDHALLDLLDDRVHRLADPRVVAARLAEAELVAEHVHQLAGLEVRQAGVRDADRLVQRTPRIGPVALEPPARGIDAERDEAVESRQPSPSAGGRRVGELRPPRGGGFPRGHRLVERSGRRRTAPRALDRRRSASVADRSSAWGCASAHVSTTRRRARASTMRTAAARPRGARGCARRCVIGRSSTARSNIGSGLDRLGKFPSATPARARCRTRAPTAPCAVSTCTASDARALPRG